MKFIHRDLGIVGAGTTVLVGLRGTEANVCLMDDVNFGKYRRSESFHHYGGHYDSSPVRLVVPHNAHWHVTVDLGGYAGQVEAEITLLAG